MRLALAAIAAALLLSTGLPAQAQAPPVSIYSGKLKPLGYCQITTLNAAVQLVTASCSTGSVPAGATVADVIVESQAVRYRDDSTAPTATVGMPLAVGTEKIFVESDLSQIRFIESTASAKLSISFY